MLYEPLARYFAGRRWFAGKGRDFVGHACPHAALVLRERPAVRIEIVTVQYDDGKLDTYQFPVAYLLEPDETMAHAYVGRSTTTSWAPSRPTTPSTPRRLPTCCSRRSARAHDRRDGFRVVKGAELPPEGSPAR